MNIADSLKHVLKNKSQNILSDFWSRDFKIILTNFSRDISTMYKNGAHSWHQLRRSGAKFSLKEVNESLADAFLIMRVFPKRVKDAFLFFKDDLLEELENLPDSKKKAGFSFKVIGALTSFTLGVIYNVKRGKTEFNVSGLRRSNAFTRFIIAELIFKITQHFLDQVLSEVEHHVTEASDKKNIRYFRRLLSSREELPPFDQDDLTEGDRAIELVDDFKNYVLTGKRRASKSSP